jgi:hypothetical protein
MYQDSDNHGYQHRHVRLTNVSPFLASWIIPHMTKDYDYVLIVFNSRKVGSKFSPFTWGLDYPSSNTMMAGVV